MSGADPTGRRALRSREAPAPAGAAEEGRVDRFGWLLLIGATALVWALAGWCFYRMLSAPVEAERRPDPPDG